MTCRVQTIILLIFSTYSGLLFSQSTEIVHPTLHNIQYKKFQNPLEVKNAEATLRKLQGLSAATNWVLLSRLNDELEQTHLRYRQYYNGIPVALGTSILHCKQEMLLSFNGDYIQEKHFVGSVKITAEQALSKAREALPAELYAWDDPGFQQIFKTAHNNPDTNYSPYAGLAYCPQDFKIDATHRLCYKLVVYTSKPNNGQEIYVDAENGNIIARQDLVLHTDVKGTVVTKYSGNQTFTVDSVSSTTFRLRNKTYGNGIETYNLNKSTSYGSAVDFVDADNYWNNVNANKDEVAGDAHWGAEQTYKYYKNTFNRNSYDNNGAKILSYVHYSSSYDNAFWNGVCMTYGDGNVFKPLTAIDVCGHEITHAVTSNSANLVYSYESGALNESFSDIFGNTIEAYARPTQWNWKIGEDITSGGSGLRNMANPNLNSNPKFYIGNYWYGGSGDNGGVHTNSGVQNYWYYLIAQGASGTNEKGWSFKIDSLGLAKAGAIAYRNLTVYLTSSSKYADARTYSIISAADLFGQCSKEVIAVTNAWWVCGVGKAYDSGYVKADFVADTLACFTGKVLNFTNLSNNYKSSEWSFGDGDTSLKNNPTHAYKSYGTFTVKLKARSCFNNKYDSLTRVSYVKVDSNFDICKSAIMPLSGTDSTKRCWGFIYDNGGEGNYKPLVQSNLKLTVPNADSIRFRFLYLDYENGYDSIVLFKNTTTQANKIGRFTGSTTPYSGAWQTVKSNTIWFKHYSDPYVEGKGFKVEFMAYRPLLTCDLPTDSTLCSGQSVDFTPVVKGGYPPQHLYTWENGSHSSIKTLNPAVSGVYKVTVKDVCTLKTAQDSVKVIVRAALKIKANKDTIICSGNSVNVKAIATGGKSSSYLYTWTPAKGNVSSFNVKPTLNTTYKVVLSDGCTLYPDSASFTIYVKPPLKVSLSTSQSLQCIGKSVNLTAKGQGGDTLGYVFAWNNGLGNGSSKSIVLTDTTKIKVTLSDGCSVVAASDSLNLFTYPAVSATRTPDTTVCRGSLVTLSIKAKGGNGTPLKYTWNTGQNTASVNLIGPNAQYYSFTVSDQCSPVFKDSIKVALLQALTITRPLDTTLCDGQAYNTSVSPAGGLTTQHKVLWLPDNVTGNTQSLNPSAVGTTIYKVILSDGCTALKDTQTFKIKRLAPLAAALSITPDNVCRGDSAVLQLSATGGKPSAYSWMLNGNPVSQLKAKIGPVITTNYNAVLTDGCSPNSNAGHTLTVNDPPVVNISISPNDYCLGQTTSFGYSGTNIAQLRWLFGNKDSLDATALATNYVYPKSGSYNVSARAFSAAGCESLVNAPSVITIYNYPTAAIIANPVITNIENPNISFTDAGSGGTSNFWDFGDGQTALNSNTIIHTYADTGWFTTNLISVTGPGCADTAVQRVRIKDVYKIFVPNTFTPDANTTNDLFIPRGRGIKSMEVKIYNRWGQKVFESKDLNKGWDGTLPNGTPALVGVYTVEVVVMDSENFRHTAKEVLHLLR